MDSNAKIDAARATVDDRHTKLEEKQREQDQHNKQVAALRAAWRELCLRDATADNDLSDEIAANEHEQDELARAGERITLAIGALERSLEAAKEELEVQLEEVGTTLHRLQYLENRAAFAQRQEYGRDQAGSGHEQRAAEAMDMSGKRAGSDEHPTQRGIDICHETVRLWWNRFGPMATVTVIGVGSIGLPAILDLGSASSRAAVSGTGCAD